MRTVLVTGISTGIGRAITAELLEKKFYVIGSVRRAEDAKYFEDKFPNQFKSIIFDVTDKDAINQSVPIVIDFLKQNKTYLCSVINNAGIALGGPVRYLDIEVFKKQFDVNYFGLINVTKAFLDLLIDSNTHPLKNKIINIGSISGKRSYPFVAPYTSSKFALEGFTDSLRRELLIHNIDVVLIEPGPIKTAIWDKVPDIDDNPFLTTEYEIPLRKFNKGYLQAIEADGYPPSIIGNKVVEIMQTNKPKTRYVITAKIFKNYYIPGFLPDRWVDRMIGKMLGLLKK